MCVMLNIFGPNEKKKEKMKLKNENSGTMY